MYKILNKKTGNPDAETRKTEYHLRLVVNNTSILFLKQKWLFSVKFYNTYIYCKHIMHKILYRKG
jgi:hypothetical protein